MCQVHRYRVVGLQVVYGQVPRTRCALKNTAEKYLDDVVHAYFGITKTFIFKEKKHILLVFVKIVSFCEKNNKYKIFYLAKLMFSFDTKLTYV